MTIEVLLDTLNKAESGPGYDGYVKYDKELSDVYLEIFGYEALKKKKEAEGWPKDYHFCWSFLLLKKIEEDNYNYKDFINLSKKVEDDSTRIDILLSLIRLTLEKHGDIEYAEKIILELPNSTLENRDIKHVGYRILLRYYAEEGNLEKFSKTLLLSSIRTSPKSDIELSKGILLSKIVEKQGFEFGLKLYNSKQFGNKYLLFLLRPLMPNFSLNEIDNLLKLYPEFLESSPHLKSTLYSEFSSIKLKQSFDINLFNSVFEYLATLEKHTIDWELYNLAITTDNKDLVNKCKKLIKSVAVRKEIKMYIDAIK